MRLLLPTLLVIQVVRVTHRILYPLDLLVELAPKTLTKIHATRKSTHTSVEVGGEVRVFRVNAHLGHPIVIQSVQHFEGVLLNGLQKVLNLYVLRLQLLVVILMIDLV